MRVHTIHAKIMMDVVKGWKEKIIYDLLSRRRWWYNGLYLVWRDASEKFREMK